MDCHFFSVVTFLCVFFCFVFCFLWKLLHHWFGTAWFGKQTSRMHYGIDKFCITCTKLITNIELQYYVNLKANFILNKLKNLPIRFYRQSIISIQSFFNVMGWKRPSNHFQSSKCIIYVKIWFFCLIHKVDFCLGNLINLQVLKWFTTYPVNITSRNKYTWYYTNI